MNLTGKFSVNCVNLITDNFTKNPTENLTESDLMENLTESHCENLTERICSSILHLANLCKYHIEDH